MQAELVIKNGLVILETGEVITDVAVQGGKIVARSGKTCRENV